MTSSSSGLEQRLRRRAEQLGGAVAHHQALLGHAEVVRQLGAQRGGMAVEVAVQPAPRRVGDGVDHRRGRVLGPRRRAEVERLDARERLLLALVGLGAQVRADLLLGHALVLPVVAEHQRGASDGAEPADEQQPEGEADGPDDRRGGEDAPEDALTLVVPGRAPGEDPEAVDALEQRQAAEEQRQQGQRSPGGCPATTESVRYWTCEAIHRLSAGIGPQKSRLTTTMRASTRVGDEAVDAPAARRAALGLRAVARRRGARTAADEQAAGVGGIGAQGGLG